jgi:vacuolar-type H+-ATPase subunit I/STV1
MNAKFLLIGLALLVFGLVLIYLEFFEPLLMYGVFLSGTWWLPILLLVLGVGFLLGSRDSPARKK